MLPIKTFPNDAKIIVDYLKTKPTGATIDSAKSALGKTAVGNNKITAYRDWGFIQKGGEKWRLTEIGRRFSEQQKNSANRSLQRSFVQIMLINLQ